jgi:DNA-binding FadR family transcriptional regulator
MGKCAAAMASGAMTGLESLGTNSLKIHLRVGDQLGLAIVRGEFAPGALLPPELRLCEMLGVSRTAVREAIRGLIAKGMIDSRPKRGTRVRDSEYWSHLDPEVLRWRLEIADTEDYLKKIFQLRHATEPAAAAIAAENADARDKSRMEAAFRAMVEAGADNVLWVEADLAFHKSIYLATHNEFFWPIGQMLSLTLKEMFRIAALGSHRPRAIIEHNDLLRAILDGKPEFARAASMILLNNAAADVRRIRDAATDAG